MIGRGRVGCGGIPEKDEWLDSAIDGGASNGGKQDSDCKDDGQDHGRHRGQGTYGRCFSQQWQHPDWGLWALACKSKHAGGRRKMKGTKGQRKADEEFANLANRRRIGGGGVDGSQIYRVEQ